MNATDTLIRTSGDIAYGTFVSYDNIHATLAHVDVGTSGDYASGLFMPGASSVTFSDARQGHVELVRTRLRTQGVSAHGLYVSKEGVEAPAVRATDTDVTTTGDRSIGAVARLGGKIAMTRGGIATSGERAYGVLASGAGSVALLTDATVTTSGLGARRSGPPATARSNCRTPTCSRPAQARRPQASMAAR
ncbi:hypothetical protein [Burkholderia ubonensis]|uniref:hypothetical protein n=1 Tax=Burkholderia ubonensis TaxID=101571 RepID=UPI001E56DB68|nr:hypothetical protein [Burkholderia ubonensis]